MRPELYATEQAHQALDWLRNGVRRRPNEQAVFSMLHAGAVSMLPEWARAELNLSTRAALDLLLDTVAVIPASRALSSALRWVATPALGGRDTAPLASRPDRSGRAPSSARPDRLSAEWSPRDDAPTGRPFLTGLRARAGPLPVRNAFGGQVIGSMATARRRRSTCPRVSPVYTIR